MSHLFIFNRFSWPCSCILDLVGLGTDIPHFNIHEITDITYTESYRPISECEQHYQLHPVASSATGAALIQAGRSLDTDTPMCLLLHQVGEGHVFTWTQMFLWVCFSSRLERWVSPRHGSFLEFIPPIGQETPERLSSWMPWGQGPLLCSGSAPTLEASSGPIPFQGLQHRFFLIWQGFSFGCCCFI